jgi:hypothetical protein
MKNNGKDLLLWSKTFAQRVIRLYLALPKDEVAAQVPGKQALRSGTSIGAN